MKSADIRLKFLEYFQNNAHQKVKSSSLIPAEDPTLLFTNAGMVQFKDCFLGVADLGFKRATTSQKCVRAGGKHNDLENVGFTPRHHTFFEMLGNFSFGDYFKKEAIVMAWELLTKVYKIPQEKLRITVFESDDEAMELWKEVGVRADWIYRLGEKENFWAMGDTGPCGPCTEIHYDWGSEYSGGKETNPGNDTNGRFLEIWNLVFMQFNRDSSGLMTPLPKPSVDTGAGLERLSAVMQGKFSNYDTDVFQPLLKAIATKAGLIYGKDAEKDVSMRVIADHLRSSAFLMADGVNPSNEGRGYVLRRILRRAIRHGKKLGQEKPFIFSLVGDLEKSLGSHYPELIQNGKMIEILMREEEERFHETIHRGIGLLEESIHKIKSQNIATLAGEVAFKLYDSYGFPFDLIEVICREQSLNVDEKVFNQLMEKQRAQSQWKGDDSALYIESITKSLDKHKVSPTFEGYLTLNTDSDLQLLFSKEGKEVIELKSGETGFAVFNKTPFYAESGGQVGDKGTIEAAGTKADVLTTSKISKITVHQVKVLNGSMKFKMSYHLVVDALRRKQTAINHTATHMMHAALRNILGERVKQAGSLVGPDRLRFDFTYPKSVSKEELELIEKSVNLEVQRASQIQVQEMSYDKAVQSGALAFFDEKYGDTVRVVRVSGEIDPFSVELCGGTHLSNTAEIGLFKITSESSVASGVRRIEAITSYRAFEFLNQRSRLFELIESKLGAQDTKALDKMDSVLSSNKSLQRENEDLKLKVVQGGFKSSSAESNVEEIMGYKVVAESIPSANPKILRTLVDQFRDKYKDKTFILLASESDGKVSLCVGITKDLQGKFDASKIVQLIAGEVGGTGGGRIDFAQAGGTNPLGIPTAFNKFKEHLKGQP